MSLEMLEIPLLNWNFDWISYWTYLFSGFITVDFWNGLLSGSQDSSCVTLVCGVFCYPEMIKTQGLGSKKSCLQLTTANNLLLTNFRIHILQDPSKNFAG